MEAQIDTTNDQGCTPLGKAVHADDVTLANFLVSKGVNINKQIGRRGTPLLLACESSTLEMVKMLIGKGGDIGYIGQGIRGTIIQAECQNQTDAQLEILSHLLGNETVNVHQTSSWWVSNLNMACLMADPNVVKWLIDRGADTNVEDMVGRRPIHFALYRTLDHVKCLLDPVNKTELFVTDLLQRNALHFAVVSGRLEVVKYILDQKPYLAKEKDCDDWTPTLLGSPGLCSLGYPD